MADYLIVSLAITAFLYFPTEVSLATSTCFSFKIGRIFEKYLFGRRFEIYNFRNLVTKFLASLPVLGFSNT